MKLIEISSPSSFKPSNFKKTTFSERKTRLGMVSAPIFDLPCGIHYVKLTNSSNGKVQICYLKVWFSMYGYAWKVFKNKPEE